MKQRDVTVLVACEEPDCPEWNVPREVAMHAFDLTSKLGPIVLTACPPERMTCPVCGEERAEVTP